MKMLGLEELAELNQMQFMEPGTGTENQFECERHVGRSQINKLWFENRGYFSLIWPVINSNMKFGRQSDEDAVIVLRTILMIVTSVPLTISLYPSSL